MKKIETKTAKNGAKLYYVDGKRVARAKAIEIAENNVRDKIRSLFDSTVDESRAEVVLTVKVKDEFDNKVEERFFFAGAEAGIAAAEKIGAEFGKRIINCYVSNLHTKQLIATNNRWGEIRISESYKAAQTSAREKLAQAFDEECDRAQAQAVLTVNVKDELGNDVTAEDSIFTAEKFFPTAEALNIQRAEKIIEDCYNTKGWGNPVYHWYNPVEDDGSNDDDDEPSAFNLLPAVDSLRDVDDEGGNDSGADTEPAQETTIDAAQAEFLITPYGVLPRVDREKLAADIEKFSDSSKPSEPVEFIRRVLYTIDKPVDVDALAAMEHIENGFEDLRNFIRFVGRKEGLTVAQCEAIYAELYCDCNKADTVYDDAFYARRDMLIDKFKAQNAAQVADKRKAQKTAPLAGRAPAVINAEFNEIVEEWIREDRAEKTPSTKPK